MNKIAKRILGIALTAFLLVGAISGLTKLTENKNISTRISPVFDYADTVDVLCFGSSNVFDAISPMEMYENYGITAYNCGSAASTIPASYWMMMNMLDYVEPKVIILDCYKLGYESAIKGYAATVYLDIFPISVTKINAIMDFRNMGISNEEAFALLMPLSGYHSRWSELEQEDFNPEYKALLKGSQMVINVATPEVQDSPTDKVIDNVEDSWGVNYLIKFIEECKQRDIKLLLVHLPFPATEDNYMDANTAQLIADEYGVDFINFLTMGLTDYDTDMFDTGTHSNPSGQKKISEYLANYIAENYNIPDRRGENGYEQWDEDLPEYIEYKQSILEEERYLNNMLMLLRDRDFSSLLIIDEKSQVYDNELVMELIRNAAWDNELPELSRAQENGESYALLIDNVNGTVTEITAQDLVSRDGLSFIDGVVYLNGEIVSAQSSDDTPDMECYVLPDSDWTQAFEHSFWLTDEGFVKKY